MPASRYAKVVARAEGCVNLLYTLDIAGTFVFAVSGALAGAKSRFDFFGVLFLAFVTAVGGGTTRDLMMGATPVFWMCDTLYLYSILVGATLTYFFAPMILRITKSLVYADAIGLGVFTIIGAEKAYTAGFAFPIVIVMGMTTCVLGGIIRDVLSNRKPLIFSKEVYATATIAGSAFFILLAAYNMPTPITYFFTGITVVLIRFLAIEFGWRFPLSHT